MSVFRPCFDEWVEVNSDVQDCIAWLTKQTNCLLSSGHLHGHASYFQAHLQRGVPMRSHSGQRAIRLSWPWCIGARVGRVTLRKSFASS